MLRILNMDKDYVVAFVFITCVKLLFIPFYHSTDMEVHRNWMAITHTNDTSQWYLENTSQWTLDYPPLFAWFEYLLSFPAKMFDPQMLNLHNIDYQSVGTILYMRLSVVVSDLLYIVAIMKIFNLLKQTHIKTDDDPWITPEIIFAMLMLWNPGLLLVDHIHFQYNGFLNGFLFLSIAAMIQEKYICAAFWFAVLLNFKHLYLYLAPAYFIYLLKNYCFKNPYRDGHVNLQHFCLKNFLKLSGTVAGVFLVSFGPYLAPSQLKQVFHQMFPVKRGLTHAYWAPNIWALYNTLDRVLVTLTRHLSGNKDFGATNVTKGLIDEHESIVLPTVKFEITLILTLLSILPFLYLVWRSPKNPTIFIQSVIGSAFGSFIFGYHVHEKAVMMMILPMTYLAVTDHTMVRPFVVISSIGHYALFPLFYEVAETPIKIIVVVLHSVYAYRSLRRLHSFRMQKNFSLPECLLLSGLLLMQLFYSFGNCVLNYAERYSFLPLMLISSFCSLGILYCWLYFCKLSLRHVIASIRSKKNM